MYTSLCTQLGKDRDFKQHFQHTQGAPQLFQASVVVVERSKLNCVFFVKNNDIKENIGTPGQCSTALMCFRENPDTVC